MNRSEVLKELPKALGLAQGKFTGAIKDSDNPFFKSTYADLQSCIVSTRDAMLENGLSISQLIEYDSGMSFLNTILMHTSGEFLSSRAPIICVKQNDPQSFGAAVTYMRRFSFCAIIGLYQTDDDGNMAAGRDAQLDKAKVNLAAAQKNEAQRRPSPHEVDLSGLQCEVCGENLSLSKSGEGVYCKNFKQGPNHSRFSVKEIPAIRALMASGEMPMFEDDVK